MKREPEEEYRPPGQTPPPPEETIQLPVDEFWESYKHLIFAGVGIVVIIAAVIVAWIVHTHNVRVESEARFAAANSITELRAVVDDFLGAVVAANALLLIAAEQRAAGDTPASDATYAELLERFPAYALAGGAALGIAQNEQRLGNTDAALANLRETADRFPDSYAAPYALLMQAEILLREGRGEEGERVLRSIILQYPETPSAQIAGRQLRGNNPPH